MCGVDKKLLEIELRHCILQGQGAFGKVHVDLKVNPTGYRNAGMVLAWTGRQQEVLRTVGGDEKSKYCSGSRQRQS